MLLLILKFNKGSVSEYSQNAGLSYVKHFSHTSDIRDKTRNSELFV